MKNAGIIILTLGIVISLFTGYRYMDKENAVNVGKLEITYDKEQTTQWSPFFGIITIFVGGGVLAYGMRKK